MKRSGDPIGKVALSPNIQIKPTSKLFLSQALEVQDTDFNYDNKV